LAASVAYYLVLKSQHPPAYPAAYVLSPTVQVVDTPAEVRLVVGSLKSGDKVDILKRTRNWAQIRTADNLTGWVELKDLLDSQTYEEGQNLLRQVLQDQPMAEGHTGGAVNLRLEPSRDATELAQLPENLKIGIYGRRMVERPSADGQPSSSKVRDAWYLIRANGQAGWVLGRFVAIDFPEKLNQYAQGTNMVAWVVLKSVNDDGQEVPEYLTAERLGTEADFSHIRVFTWWVKNHKYVTAYVEGGLNGYFPIRVRQIDGVPYFRLRLVDEQGRKYQKVYGLFDTITRSVGVVPGWESDAMPEARESGRRSRVHHKKD
jgi:uncharacterized protein YgiM (DUF1202 family)